MLQYNIIIYHIALVNTVTYCNMSSSQSCKTLHISPKATSYI